MSSDPSSVDENEARSVYNEFFMYKGIPYGPHTSLEIIQKCEKFAFRPDDVVVATYPRSGTTLTQEIVWQIVNHDRVTKGGQYGGNYDRFPFLELDQKRFAADKSKDIVNPVDALPNWTTKRLIKTHLPYALIRDEFEKVNPKMVIVMRNPKDNVVSCFNFSSGLQRFKDGVTFKDYLRIFKSDYISYGDFRDFNLTYWSLRDRENVLIVYYEDIVRQPFQEIRKIALFLGYSLTAEKIAAIVHNTIFDVMSKNESVNFRLPSGTHHFMRKGKFGEWKNWLTVAQNEDMNAWIAEKLRGTGLHFIYE